MAHHPSGGDPLSHGQIRRWNLELDDDQSSSDIRDGEFCRRIRLRRDYTPTDHTRTNSWSGFGMHDETATMSQSEQDRTGHGHQTRRTPFADDGATADAAIISMPCGGERPVHRKVALEERGARAVDMSTSEADVGGLTSSFDGCGTRWVRFLTAYRESDSSTAAFHGALTHGGAKSPSQLLMESQS